MDSTILGPGPGVQIVEHGRKIHEEKNCGENSRPPPPRHSCPGVLSPHHLTAALYYLNAWNGLLSRGLVTHPLHSPTQKTTTSFVWRNRQIVLLFISLRLKIKKRQIEWKRKFLLLILMNTRKVTASCKICSCLVILLSISRHYLLCHVPHTRLLWITDVLYCLCVVQFVFVICSILIL